MTEPGAAEQTPGPCPKCGAPVALRSFEGRHYTKCQGPGCFFGFDAAEDGSPLAPCPACGTGRLKTTPKGRVCADCGKWDNGGEAPRSTLGPCPKCHKGQLSQRSGQYGPFVSCSDRACGLIYDCDEAGQPKGGVCLKCQGPVKLTKGGSRICAVCETWQDAKPGAAPRSPADAARPPKPADANCPGCRQSLRALWTRKGKWAYRCDACDRWMDAPQ